MLYFDKTDVSERIDGNKTAKSKERDTFHYWYFLNIGFKLQSYVCNRCYDLLIMSMNPSDIAILKLKNANYCCIITGISKMKLYNYCKILTLMKKREHYKYTEQFKAINLLENLFL